MIVADAIDRLRAVRPGVVDVWLALALAVALVLQLILADEPGASPVAVVAALALTLPLAWRRRAPLAVAVGFAAVAALQGALGAGLYAGEPPLLAALVSGGVAFYSLGAFAAEHQAVVGVAVGILGLWTTVIVSDDREVQSYVFSAGIVALAPWLAGRATHARDLRTRAFQRERDQRGRTAASEERQRIARELHDVVAHGVMLMVLQAQGARRILEHDRERVLEALLAIEDTGQTALTEMRQSLGVLRDNGEPTELEPQPRLSDLGGLVDEMRAAGLRVELDVRGPERELADGIDRSAYRIVQEALTNTVKHAGLVPTHVTVSYSPDELRLEILDHGPGSGRAADKHSTGQGLVGMRERVRVYGGELEAHPENGRGFVVRACIPLVS